MIAKRSNENNCTQQEENEPFAYSKDAVSAVTFKIVYSKKDTDEGRYHQFKPDMAHQVFGDSEKIFGYRSVAITLNYHHNSSKCYPEVVTSGRIDAVNSNFPEPDDIDEKLNPWLPKEQFNSVNDLVNSESHDVKFGTVISEFNSQEHNCTLFPDRNVPVNYKLTICQNIENFKDFHERFQTYVIWFIDAANFIDLTDDRWIVFYLYEEFQHPDQKINYSTPIGYCAIYKFFAYPDKNRMRISQFLILPPFQKQGLGKKMYKEIVKYLRLLPDTLDITVEDPTPVFQRIRDVDDCIMTMGDFKKANVNINTTSLKVLFNKMEANLKICKKQRQRVLDIIRCYEAKKASIKNYEEYLAVIAARIKHEVEKELHNYRKKFNNDRMEQSTEQHNKNVAEIEVKNYLDDIAPSVAYLEKFMLQE